MQNDMREILIDLIKQGARGHTLMPTECIADHLIASGVIVIPCKVGDIVYQTDGVRIYELEIFDVSMYRNMPHFETESVDFDIRAIGTSIFLTKDQAEQKLKELSENG